MLSFFSFCPIQDCGSKESPYVIINPFKTKYWTMSSNLFHTIWHFQCNYFWNFHSFSYFPYGEGLGMLQKCRRVWKHMLEFNTGISMVLWSCLQRESRHQHDKAELTTLLFRSIKVCLTNCPNRASWASPLSRTMMQRHLSWHSYLSCKHRHIDSRRVYHVWTFGLTLCLC